MIVEVICAPRDFPLISILASSFSVGEAPSADGCMLNTKMISPYCLRRFSLKSRAKETIVMHAGEWNLQLPTLRLSWMPARDKGYDNVAEERTGGKPALKQTPGDLTKGDLSFKVQPTVKRKYLCEAN
jgi:hypothetical protein